MARSNESTNFKRILLGGGLATASVFAIGKFVDSNPIFRDGNGGINVHYGPVDIGGCVLSSRDNRHPLTEPQKKSTIQEIGRLCGFCDPTTVITNKATGIGHTPCADLETIELQDNPDGTTTVLAYLTTKPEAPEGLVYTFFTTNSGLCNPTLGNIEGNMSADFSRRFDPAIAAQLIPHVEQAPGSDACPDRPLASVTTLAP